MRAFHSRSIIYGPAHREIGLIKCAFPLPVATCGRHGSMTFPKRAPSPFYLFIIFGFFVTRWCAGSDKICKICSIYFRFGGAKLNSARAEVPTCSLIGLKCSRPGPRRKSAGAATGVGHLAIDVANSSGRQATASGMIYLRACRLTRFLPAIRDTKTAIIVRAFIFPGLGSCYT